MTDVGAEVSIQVVRRLPEEDEPMLDETRLGEEGGGHLAEGVEGV